MSLKRDLDWEQHWFSVLAPDGEAVFQWVGAGATLPQALTERAGSALLTGASRPLRFVPQDDL
ncbi:MAG TPA: hypothetical protein VFY22_02355, partial [Hydrogenophaga sp.]|nr:hypothetical protein [Hydrogenophaga sp.]